MKTIEVFKGLKVNVYCNGTIETLPHLLLRKNGRIDNRKGKILKPTKTHDGYLRVTFSFEGKRKSFLVHRLVALAFLPNPLNKETVNHINGIKTDNRVENLEWATHKEQKEHSIKHHLCDKNIEKLKEANQKRAKKIIYEGKYYNSIKEASRKVKKSEDFIKKKFKRGDAK